METDNGIAKKLIETAVRTIEGIEATDFHSVSSAARSADGRIFTGVNVFHFVGGPCAEMTVLGTAAAAGVKDTELTHIVAVVNRGNRVINPCGKCRQALLDLHPNITVIVVDGDGGHHCKKILELLPFPYVWPEAPHAVQLETPGVQKTE